MSGHAEAARLREREAERTRAATAPTSALHTEAAAGGEDPRAGEAEEEGAWWPAATPGGRATPGDTTGAPLEGEDTEPGGAGEAASGGQAAMAVGSNGGDVNDFVFMVFICCFFCSFFFTVCADVLFYFIVKSGI